MWILSKKRINLQNFIIVYLSEWDWHYALKTYKSDNIAEEMCKLGEDPHYFCLEERNNKHSTTTSYSLNNESKKDESQQERHYLSTTLWCLLNKNIKAYIQIEWNKFYWSETNQQCECCSEQWNTPPGTNLVYGFLEFRQFLATEKQTNDKPAMRIFIYENNKSMPVIIEWEKQSKNEEQNVLWKHISNIFELIGWIEYSSFNWKFSICSSKGILFDNWNL